VVIWCLPVSCRSELRQLALELAHVEIVVETLRGNQLVVRAALDNFAR
jgi:hypothetical protein